MTGAGVKDGRALIESDNAGGYLQFTETVFDSGPTLRFSTRVQFDGTAGDAVLDDRPIKYGAKQMDPRTFELSIREPRTDRVTSVLRFSTDEGDRTLTIVWSDAAGASMRKLVYQRAPEGPLLETGRAWSRRSARRKCSVIASVWNPANTARAKWIKRAAQ